MRCRTFAILGFAALAAVALRAPAQIDRTPTTGMVRVASGKYLEISKPRQVMNVDHVDSIVYRPGTHRITTLSHRVSDGRVTSTIRLVLGDTGKYDTLIANKQDLLGPLTQQYRPQNANAVDVDTSMRMLEGDWDYIPPTYEMLGWSGDGRYLLVDNATWTSEDVQYLRIDALEDPARTAKVALGGYFTVERGWSPDRTRLLFLIVESQDKPADQTARHTTFSGIYDPATNQVTKLEVKGYRPEGWLDNSRLLLLAARGGKSAKPYLAHDVHTGEEITLTQADVDLMKQDPLSPLACPANPDLLCAITTNPIMDGQATQLVQSIWLKTTATHGASQATPEQVGVRAPTPPAHDVSVTIGIAAAGRAQDPTQPQIAWASDGRQFAYTLSGNLYVVDVTEHQPTMQERLAAGEQLPCDEMKKIATSNLKQIGLAIIQYVQDYDEKFPPADNINERIYPYIKSQDLYSVGPHPWVYIPPASPDLAKMDSPAETPLGRIDLDCGSVILYADGHVRAAADTPAQEK